MFEDGIKAFADFENDGSVLHCIYCADHFFDASRIEVMRFVFLVLLKKYKIESLIMTFLIMRRENLITKEEVEKAYVGILNNNDDWKDGKLSVNDDLELFFTDLVQNQGYFGERSSNSFFTPKLSQQELELMEQGDFEYLMSFYDYEKGFDPDVDYEKMRMSVSKSKYLHGTCQVITVPLMADDLQHKSNDLDIDSYELAKEIASKGLIVAEKIKRRQVLWQNSKVLFILFLLLVPLSLPLFVACFSKGL